MTGKERVFEALAHHPADRLPRNYIAKPEVTDRLMKHLGAADEEAMLEALGIDLRRISHAGQCPPPVAEEGGWVRTVFGVRMRLRENSGGHEFACPFGDASTLEDIEAHPWPDPAALDYSEIRPQCERYAAGYATYGSPWCPFFHDVGWLTGEERLLTWMLDRPEMVHALTEKVTNYYLEVTRRFFEAAGGLLDIAYFGNDYGTQQNLLVSPAQWSAFFREPQKAFFALARDFGCRVMFHSCGAIRPLIPMLIEDGVAILDPIQIRASGMSPEALLADFGNRLSLHGGIDTQHTLPFGSADDVRAERERFARHARAHGGYILMGSQKLTDDIPTENILAMYGI